MKKILLALFLVGCGNSLPTDETTQWTVTLGSWETPTCEGAMTLTPKAEPSPFADAAMFSGTWQCGSFGSLADADFRTDGRAFLNLERVSGGWMGVRGTFEAGDAIEGDMLTPDGLIRFAAYRQ
jgi:hypothetical protein